VGLVTDHEVVDAALEILDVPGEPGVGLNGDQVAARGPLAAGDGRRQPAAIAFFRQLAVELGDEQAPVREDQDAHGPSRLDEAGGGDRLARGGWMPEAVATRGARIGLGRRREWLELPVGLVLLVLGLELGYFLRRERAVAVALRLTLVGGDQLGQHPRQRIDLMAAQLGPRLQLRRPLAEHPFQPEHQRVADLPLRRRLGASGFDLLHCVVKGTAAGRAGREHRLWVFVRVEKRLARPGFRARDILDKWMSRLSRNRGLLDSFVQHGRHVFECRNLRRKIAPAHVPRERCSGSVPELQAGAVALSSASGCPATRSEIPV
jgi:hypothetical protein